MEPLLAVFVATFNNRDCCHFSYKERDASFEADIKMTGTKKKHFAKSLSAKNFKPTCVLGLK